MVPYVIGGLAVLAWLRAPSQKKVLSPEHLVIFETAMTDLHHSGKLRELADAFDKYGAKTEAAILRKRAATRDLPKEVKKQRGDVFRQAMASKDPDVVESIALLFEQQACTGAARELYTRARSLHVAQRVPAPPPPSVPLPVSSPVDLSPAAPAPETAPAPEEAHLTEEAPAVNSPNTIEVQPKE